LWRGFYHFLPERWTPSASKKWVRRSQVVPGGRRGRKERCKPFPKKRRWLVVPECEGEARRPNARRSRVNASQMGFAKSNTYQHPDRLRGMGGDRGAVPLQVKISVGRPT